MAKTESWHVEKRDEKFWLPGTDLEILEQLAPMVVPIGSVKPREKNPRITKNLEMLMEGMRRFGVRWPIIVNKSDGTIEAGHKRYEALVSLGSGFIPVLYVDDDQLTADAFTISDNRTGEKVAKWDDKILNEMLAGLLEEDSLDGVGFVEDDVKLPIGDTDDLGDIVDLDALLDDVVFSDAVAKPIWVVIRTTTSNREMIETALGRIADDESVKIEKSYEVKAEKSNG